MGDFISSQGNFVETYVLFLCKYCKLCGTHVTNEYCGICRKIIFSFCLSITYFNFFFFAGLMTFDRTSGAVLM